MARAIISPKFYAWDRDGKPLAFGKVYTYQARTNTPKPTYQSEDQVVPNANPVILNGEGYANIYLDGSYKIVLKDKDENEIWTADPVTQSKGDGDTYSQFTLTGYYAAPTTVEVLGDYTTAILEGMKITVTSVGANGKDSDVTSTVVGSSFNGSRTSIVITDAIVTTSIKCVSVTNWPFEEISAIEEFVESSETTFETPQGQTKKTITGIEKLAFSKVASVPVNGGVWAEGVVFNAYNEYMIYNGVSYKPKTTTVLPYVSTLIPDVNFVEPFSDLNTGNSSYLQEQISGLSVFPESTIETAQVGDTVPSGTTALRDHYNNKIYSLSGSAAGVIQSLDFSLKTATISNVDFLLSDLPDGLMIKPVGYPGEKSLADIASKVERGTFVSVSEAKSFTSWTDGDSVSISDMSGHRFKYQSSRELIVGQPVTEITFDDEIHILVDSGGMLVFDDWGVLPILESQNYAKYESKIRGKTDVVKMDCYGDSITYAQANANDAGAVNRIGEPTNFGDGSTYQHWQFTNNYPSYLQGLLSNNALRNQAVVYNRGYSGDRMYNGYLRHRVVSDADVSLIMYGVNDTLFATSNGANPEQVANNGLYKAENFNTLLLKFCAREILRGKALILMGCIPFNSLTGYDGTGLAAAKLTKAYSDVTESVAKLLNAKYIDTMSDIFRQYSDIYNDGTHLNDDGLKILGNKMGVPLMMGGYKGDHSVKSGSVLLANELHSRIQSVGLLPILPNLTSSTPWLINGEPSTIQLVQEVSDRNVYIPFYAEEDNLVIYPSIYANGTANLDLVLNGGALNPVNLSSYPLSLSASRADNGKSVSVTQFKNRSNVHYSLGTAEPFIHVPTKGWHHLVIRNTGGTVNTFLDSLVFESITNVLANDVEGGISSFAHFNPNPVAIGIQKNIGSIVRNSIGNYTVTFETPLANGQYAIIANALSGADNRTVAYSNVTANGFDLAFTEGPGAGSGVSWNLYDPTVITFKTIGGR